MWILFAAVGGLAVFLYRAAQDVEPVCTSPCGAVCNEPLGFLGVILGIGNLTAKQIAQFAQNAGFGGTDLATAVAVALAESGGGNPRAYNPELAAKGGTPQGQGSYGLWQIYLKMHPEFAGQNLFDPQTNADAAFRVYVAAGSTFNPWATYNPHDGSVPKYLAHIDTANQAVADLGSPALDAALCTADCSTGVICPDEAGS
jgi:hypothetical protein